jgi:hypothetical protein
MNLLKLFEFLLVKLNHLQVHFPDGRKSRLLLIYLPVEVANIVPVIDLRLNGSSYSQLLNVIPVDPLEPRVSFNILPAENKPFLRVLGEALLNQHLKVVGYFDNGGKVGLQLEDLIEHHLLLLVVERRQSVNHLVEEHSEAPNVHGLPVALLVDDLRGNVLGGPNVGESDLIRFDVLGDSEVGQGSVAMFVEQNVLGFHVPVQNAFVVQVDQSAYDLTGVELNGGFGESSLGSEVVVEFSSLLELHGEEDHRLVGVAVLQVDHEGVVILVHDFSLIFEVIDEVPLNDIDLLDCLNGKEPSVILLLGQVNLPVVTSAQQSDQIERILSDVLVIGSLEDLSVLDLPEDLLLPVLQKLLELNIVHHSGLHFGVLHISFLVGLGVLLQFDVLNKIKGHWWKIM